MRVHRIPSRGDGAAERLTQHIAQGLVESARNATPDPRKKFERTGASLPYQAAVLCPV